MLNDLFLGKVVGDKENSEEISQLESVLQNLAGETNFKVNIDELKSNMIKSVLTATEKKLLKAAEKFSSNN